MSHPRFAVEAPFWPPARRWLVSGRNLGSVLLSLSLVALSFSLSDSPLELQDLLRMRLDVLPGQSERLRLVRDVVRVNLRALGKLAELRALVLELLSVLTELPVEGAVPQELKGKSHRDARNAQDDDGLYSFHGTSKNLLARISRPS